MTIKTQLDSIDNTKNLLQLVKELKPQNIGILGGRRFVQEGKTGTICLNDVIRKLKHTIDDLCARTSDVNELKPELKEIISEINSKNASSYALLEESGLIARILTAIKSWIGSFQVNRAQQLRLISDPAYLDNLKEQKKQNALNTCIDTLKKMSSRDLWVNLSEFHQMDQFYPPESLSKEDMNQNIGKNTYAGLRIPVQEGAFVLSSSYTRCSAYLNLNYYRCAEDEKTFKSSAAYKLSNEEYNSLFDAVNLKRKRGFLRL